MRKVEVYQSETNSMLLMDYIGSVKYVGKDDPLSFTNGKTYIIVRDKDQNLKVVDDTEEDYIYDLREPNDIGGIFFYRDDPYDILRDYMERSHHEVKR
ncbi:hypothetical protein [Aedoeadaptatus coxii]|uniref:hypothetical protein n=1 Tax=Aedoeadaptatus coxii TaxID=755172 RepID=UPI002AD559F8|nr:hypothetical protein [Peptoniphilus coxii]